MKFLLYIECLIVFTLYRIIMSIIKELARLGTSAEWYSARGLHAFEAKKALAQYNKEYNEEIERKLRSINK